MSSLPDMAPLALAIENLSVEHEFLGIHVHTELLCRWINVCFLANSCSLLSSIEAGLLYDLEKYNFVSLLLNLSQIGSFFIGIISLMHFWVVSFMSCL